MKRNKTNMQNLVDAGYSINQIANEMNISQTTVIYWLKKYRLKTHKQAKGTRSWNDDDLILAIKNSETKAEVIRKLGLAVRPGNYETIDKYIKKLNLDVSHFSGRGHGKPQSPNISIENLLVENSFSTRARVKRRVLKENLIQNKCQICGIQDTWQNKPIVLVLDHINGINNDHRLENLRMLCPNCNSQTNTFCSRK